MNGTLIIRVIKRGTGPHLANIEQTDKSSNLVSTPITSYYCHSSPTIPLQKIVVKGTREKPTLECLYQNSRGTYCVYIGARKTTNYQREKEKDCALLLTGSSPVHRFEKVLSVERYLSIALLIIQAEDPCNLINTNIRPPDLNLPVGARPDLNLPVRARPVLNYSIQTGEEFALEFMRERVNPRQHIVPNSSSEPNSATLYMDVKGTLGIFHAEKVYGQPFQSVNQTSSERKSSHGFHSHTSSRASGSSSPMLKLLCSFGGKILPRPSDGKLRYVGGETRIFRISKDISWEDLVQKTWIIYNQPHTIKYQLPDEDLDSLVSVSCDEDLQNMMEECNVLKDGGAQKLRMFLISNDDLNDSQLGFENPEGDSEIQYVVAVNGMDFGSRRNSIAMENSSGNNLEELLGLRVERETGQIAVGLAVAGSAHPEVGMPSVNQSSQMMLPTSSHAFESNPRGNQVQTMNHGQPELHQSHTFHRIESFQDADYKNNIPQSVPTQYNYGSHPSIMCQLLKT
ncbi:Protein kinase superfamily protein with octicosapeptide/Phox/Bem1p domain [Forsythia ovata]|uniref:Protein kinase superfamily protein with octicosapeptide/Phox/Bem1p domain n=1 Tax=Forsythia ovata TaxID=205694 RepID=A0ABD1QCM7_9LAMI